MTAVPTINSGTLVDMLVVVGTPSECRERLRELSGLGLNR